MDNVLKKIKQGTVAIIPETELDTRWASGKKLKIKLGADPTAPDLHLGHAIVLRKMRQFQDAGHDVIFLIGDFTARIGDPSGKSKTRPPLDPDTIAKNTKTYFEQVGKVLDLKKLRITFNSEWLGKLNFSDVIALCGKVTLSRIIEREDFANRLINKQSIGMHELLYPLLQGYDSVALEADVELGGTDQTFNLLMGRTLQEHYNQRPQIVITTPLLEGLDGIQKMSKSLGNYIGLSEAPDQAFGKLMSISDELMWRYAQLLLLKTESEIAAMKSLHPMQAKKQIAHEIIATFWSKAEADEALHRFESVFQKGDLSEAREVPTPATLANPVWIVDFLKTLGAIESSSEAKRLVESGAVHIDGTVYSDFKAMISWHTGTTVKVGKHRIYKLV